MDKQDADRMITEYLPKIYGFAARKCYTYDETEELSADIVQEVYLSLRKAEEVVNPEGYIWRISEHVYAKYVAARKRHLGVSIDGMEIPFEEDYDALQETGEEIIRLRREIAFLTRKQPQFITESVKDVISVPIRICRNIISRLLAARTTLPEQSFRPINRTQSISRFRNSRPMLPADP